MANKTNIFLSTILFGIINVASSCQTLRSQSLNGIPLEAFEGFKKDSFTLPGDSFAQPVFKYGIFRSKVTTNLIGVGKVYVHHVLYFQDEYSFMEIYSRKPSSGFINGIKRYGNFRMYTHRQFVSDSDYVGNPRIEFVQGLNTINKTIDPLTIFKISGGNELKLSTANAGDVTDVTYEVKDFKKYVDPILYDSLKFQGLGPNCYFSGWIQYDLESDIIKVDLFFAAGEDFVLSTFESVIYDSFGNLIGHITGYGPLSFVSITANHQYVYTNTGGAVTEDYIAPYVFRIFDIESGEIVFSRRSTTNELSGYAIPHSNLGVFQVNKPFREEYSELESYIIDHDKGLMYILHLNPLCQSPSHTTFYPTYCECYTENGLKSKIYYEKDLTSIKFN